MVRKGNESTFIRKEGIKVLFTNDVIIYIENLRINNKISETNKGL